MSHQPAVYGQLKAHAFAGGAHARRGASDASRQTGLHQSWSPQKLAGLHTSAANEVSSAIGAASTAPSARITLSARLFSPQSAALEPSGDVSAAAWPHSRPIDGALLAQAAACARIGSRQPSSQPVAATRPSDIHNTRGMTAGDRLLATTQRSDTAPSGAGPSSGTKSEHALRGRAAPTAATHSGRPPHLRVGVRPVGLSGVSASARAPARSPCCARQPRAIDVVRRLSRTASLHDEQAGSYRLQSRMDHTGARESGCAAQLRASAGEPHSTATSRSGSDNSLLPGDSRETGSSDDGSTDSSNSTDSAESDLEASTGAASSWCGEAMQGECAQSATARVAIGRARDGFKHAHIHHSAAQAALETGQSAMGLQQLCQRTGSAALAPHHQQQRDSALRTQIQPSHRGADQTDALLDLSACYQPSERCGTSVAPAQSAQAEITRSAAQPNLDSARRSLSPPRQISSQLIMVLRAQQTMRRRRYGQGSVHCATPLTHAVALAKHRQIAVCSVRASAADCARGRNDAYSAASSMPPRSVVNSLQVQPVAETNGSLPDPGTTLQLRLVQHKQLCNDLQAAPPSRSNAEQHLANLESSAVLATPCQTSSASPATAPHGIDPNVVTGAVMRLRTAPDRAVQVRFRDEQAWPVSAPVSSPDHARCQSADSVESGNQAWTDPAVLSASNVVPSYCSDQAEEGVRRTLKDVASASESSADSHAGAARAQRIQQDTACTGAAKCSAISCGMSDCVGLLAQPPAPELAPLETSLRPADTRTRGALSRQGLAGQQGVATFGKVYGTWSARAKESLARSRDADAARASPAGVTVELGLQPRRNTAKQGVRR